MIYSSFFLSKKENSQRRGAPAPLNRTSPSQTSNIRFITKMKKFERGIQGGEFEWRGSKWINGNWKSTKYEETYYRLKKTKLK
jgi:hypothetical protein